MRRVWPGLRLLLTVDIRAQCSPGRSLCSSMLRPREGGLPGRALHGRQKRTNRRSLLAPAVLVDGAPRGNRTPNPLIKSQLLCLLS